MYFTQQTKNGVSYIKLNIHTDWDIIWWMWSQPSKQGSIKKLIREEMARGAEKNHQETANLFNYVLFGFKSFFGYFFVKYIKNIDTSEIRGYNNKNNFIKKIRRSVNMIRSSSVMKNIQDVCSALRQKYFGEAASQKDYKDSFVINKAIDSFKGLPEDLMTESISQKDQSETKGSKSINYRSDCYEKLSTIATALQIPESEVCRRIMYYSLEEHNGSGVTIELSVLKEKVIFLKKEMEKSMVALNEVMLAISLLENRYED